MIACDDDLRESRLTPAAAAAAADDDDVRIRRSRADDGRRGTSKCFPVFSCNGLRRSAVTRT